MLFLCLNLQNDKPVFFVLLETFSVFIKLFVVKTNKSNEQTSSRFGLHTFDREISKNWVNERTTNTNIH